MTTGTCGLRSARRVSRRARLTRKARCSAILSAAVLGLSLAAPTTAWANDFLWDADGAGAGEGGSGNWDLVGTNWFGDHEGLGNSTYGAWPNTLTLGKSDAVAVFGAVSPGAVGVTATGINVNGLTFSGDGWTLGPLSGPQPAGGSPALNLVGGNDFEFPVLSVSNAGATATINLDLAMAAGLTEWTKAGSGTLVLNGNNTLSGKLNLTDGTLSFASAGALGTTNAITIASSGVLRYTAASGLTLAPVVTSNGAIDVSDAAGQLTVNLADFPNQVRKQGAGTLVLTSASNNAVSTLFVDRGTVSVANPDVLTGTGQVFLGTDTVPATLAVGTASGQSNFSLILGAAGGTIQVGAGTMELWQQVTGGPLPVNDTTPATLTGLTKTGAGALKLSAAVGAVANSFTGNVLIKEGALEITADTDLGHGTNGVTLDGGTLRLGGGANAVIDPGAGATATFNSKYRVFRIGDAGGTFDVRTNTGGTALTFQINDGPVFTAPYQLQSVNPITGPDALNPDVASPDVLTKKGPGTMLVGNPTDTYATSFTGTTVVMDGLVRVDGAGALGLRQITVTNDPVTTGAGKLASNTAAATTNKIILRNGGTIGAIGGDRVFSGPITIESDTTFSSQDMAASATDRSITLTGPVTDNGKTITISGNSGNVTKGVTLANFTATPSAITGQWLVEANGMLAIGGKGTGASSVTGLTDAQLQNNVQLKNGGTFGLRSDEATTFGAFPQLPATSFGLFAAPLNNANAAGLTLGAGPLSLSGQTVTVSTDNGYRLAPSSLTMAAGTTLDLKGGTLVPNQISAAGTINLTGNGAGNLIINNEAGGGPHSLAGATFDLKPGGRLTLQGGSVGTDPIGGANLTFSGGILALTSTAGGAVFDRSLTIAQNGTIQHIGSTTNSFGAGSSGLTINPDITLTLDIVGGTLNLPTTINGAGHLTKTGPGTLAISADNSASHTGGVNLEAGRLVLDNAAGKSIGSALRVNAGVADLAGTTQSIPSVILTGGAIANGTLSSNSITKTGGPASVAEISARINSTGGTITSNAGTLRLSNTATGAAANSLTGATVSATGGGTIRAQYTSGGSNPLGAGGVSLNGGNLVLSGISGVSASSGGLGGSFYNLARVADNGQNGWTGFNSLPQLEAALEPFSPAASSLSAVFNYSNVQTNSFAQNEPGPVTIGNVPTNTQNVVAVWRGKINIAAAGEHKFYTNSDDGSVMFIDGVKVVENNFDQGTTDRYGTVNLTAGLHDVVMAYFQGGGGAVMTVNYMAPGMFARALLPGSILYPSAVDAGNDVLATGSSSIRVTDAGVASLGTLTLGGGALRVDGAIAPTNINLAGNASIDTSLLGGAVIAPSTSESGGSFKLTKTGPGTLVAAGPMGHTGGTDIDGGTLRVTVPIALATAGSTNVNSGGLLDVQVADARLANAIVNPGGRLVINGVTQTIASGASAPTAPIAGTLELRNVTMGAGYNVKMAPGGTLQFTPNADRNHSIGIELTGAGSTNIASSGNTQTLSAPITGTGGASFTSNAFNLEAANTFSGLLRIDGGTARLRNSNGTALNVTQIDILGGEINVSDHGAGNINANRVANNAVVNLVNGTVSAFMRDAGGEAEEVVGTLNLIGNGRVALTVTGTGASRPFVNFTNFNRTPGSRLSIEGTNMGGTQTNHAQVKFGTAPPLIGGIVGGWAVVNNADFATYGANGFAPLTGANTGGEAAWVSDTTNFKTPMAADITLGGARTANSLVLTRTAGTLVNFNGNALALTTGGLLAVTNETINLGSGITGTVPAASLTNDPGTLTAGPGQSELFLSLRTSVDNKFLDLTTKIIDNGAPLAVVTNSSGNAGNIIRLRNPENSFTGGLYIDGGVVESRGYNDVGNALGTGTVRLNGGTLNLRDANSGDLSYGNSVAVNANSTISVDRGTGASTGTTFVMGDLSIAEGRTLTTATGNSYRVDFDDLTLAGSATINGAANTTIRGVTSVPAGATLTKTGAGFLNLQTDNSATFLGSVAINGGSVQITHNNALGGSAPQVTVNSGGRFVVNTPHFNFSNTTFNPGGVLQLRQDQSVAAGATIPNQPLSVLELETTFIGSDFDGVRMAPNSIIRPTIGTTSNYSYGSDLVLLGNVEVTNGANVVNLVELGGVISGSGTLIRNETQSELRVNLTAANTYTGGTISVTGARPIRGQVTGAFGTGPVIALSGSVELNATGAASNEVVAMDSPILYNANGGAGGNLVRAGGDHPLAGPYIAARLGTGTTMIDGKTGLGLHGQITLANTITDFLGDTFEVRSFSIISGDATRLGMLNRNASGLGAANIKLEENAIIAHATNSASTIQDLGNNTDVYFGLAVDHNHALTIGAGTPWKGISTDRSDRRYTTGPIRIDDGSNGGAQPATVTQVFLHGINSTALTLGNNTTPISIVPNIAGGGKVEVVVDAGPYKLPGDGAQENNNRLNLDSGTTAAPINNFSGVSLFRVFGHLGLHRDNAQAGVPIVVESGGQIDFHVANDATNNRTGLYITAPVTLKAGGMLIFDDAKNIQKGAAGLITAEPGAIVRLHHADAVMNEAGDGVAPQWDFAGSRAPDGLVVRMRNSNIQFLNEAIADKAIFVVANGDRSFNPALGAKGLVLSGGMLTQDNSDRSVTVTSASTEAITVNGTGNFSSTRSRTFNIDSNVSAAAAAITVGTTEVVDGYLKDGTVNFRNGVVTAKSMNIVTGNAIAGANNGAGVIAGTFATDGVTLGDETRFEMNLNLATAITNVAQKFIIDGDYLHRDRRRFLVSRSAGSNTVVNLSNVTLNAGSALAIDESNSDVRVNATLAGNATAVSGVNDQFEWVGIQSSVPGTRRTLTLGRIADGFGIPAFHNQSVFGTVTGDITVNQAKGGLTFTPNSNLLPGAEIFNVGFGPAGNLEDGAVVIQSGRDRDPIANTGSAWLSGGKIIMNGDQDLLIHVDEVAAGAQQKVNNPNIVVEIQAGNGVYPSGIGRIQAVRNVDITTAGAISGRVIVNEVIANSRSIVQLEHQNQQELQVRNITLSGDNATILNFATTNEANTRVFVNNITDPANNKTVTLTGRAFRIPGASTISAGRTVLDAHNVDFEPGAGNTATVTGNLQVNTVLNLKNGTLNLGSKNITGQAATAGFVSGLRENVLPTNDNQTTATPSGGLVRVGTERADLPHGFGIVDNTTVVYTGQIFIPDNGTAGDGQGSAAFAESFDDNVFLRIDTNNDGTLDVIFDNNGAVNAASGVQTMASGWHDFEVRLGEGGGGSGPWSQAGWNRAFGFGIDVTDPIAPETSNPLQANYVPLRDDGTMNLLRTTTTGFAGTLNVDAGSTLTAGSIQGLAAVNILGSATLQGGVDAAATIVGNGTAAASLNATHVRGGTLAIRNNAAVTLSAKPQGTVSKVTALTFGGDGTLGWQGRLDLKNNAIVVQDGNLANITSQVKQGMNAGGWDGTAGIVSSIAADDAADGLSATGVAVIRNSDDGATPIMTSFGGVSVDANSIVARQTYHGDSDLNGTLNAEDYLRADRGFLSFQDADTGNDLLGYRWGDVNYDGTTNILDFFMIDLANSLQHASGPLALADIGPAAVSGPAPLSASASAVPEPGVIAGIAIGAIGLLRRRRRTS